MLITILADTDYYSHTGPLNIDVSSMLSEFLDFKVPLDKAHKTGLGSSAALVTAFTAAVLTHYVPLEVMSVTSDSGKPSLHNLAQVAHCAAQGKIGSGFDIAAAVYGSCTYKRFSPSLLQDVGEIGKKGFATRLRLIVEDMDQSKKWDMQIVKSTTVLPKGLRLVMCDVDCGSETVGMVKSVLTWRRDRPEEAALLWGTLQKWNEDLAAELQRLVQQSRDDGSDYENLRDIIMTIRSLIREMSEKAKVPIEPNVQTDLLDACSRVPGVVGGVVPGAGGFDAIALLVEDKTTVISRLHQLLDTYKTEANGGDGGSIGKVRVLGVKQDYEGVKEELPSVYVNWLR